MNCKNVCRLCRSLVLSEEISYDATTDTLNITLPETEGIYFNNCRVCIVIAQTIPTTTTINALVNIVIGASTFPLLDKCCNQVTACQIKTRTKYPTKVVTNTVSGSFRVLSNLCCTKPDSLVALPITEGGA